MIDLRLSIGSQGWLQFVRARFAGAVALLALTSSGVHAEFSVKAVAAGVRVEAKEARVDEIMTRLRSDMGLRYRSSAALDHRVTGTFEGSLLQVLARVLSSYDYIIKNEASTLEVVVVDFGSSGRAAVQKVTDPIGAAPGSSTSSKPVSAVGATAQPVQAAPASGGETPPAQPAAARPVDFGQAVSAAAAPSAMPPQGPGTPVAAAAAPASRPPPPMVGNSMAPVASDPNANGPRGNPGPR